MTFLWFTGLFALLGIGIPLIFQGMWTVVNYLQIENIEAHIVLQSMTLMLWPSSLMTLPASTPEVEKSLFLIGLIANVVFYVILGAIIWLGIKKHFAFLVVAASVILVIWWKLLTL